MPLLESAYTLATIVGLLCNWKAERDTQKGDKFQHFMIWLENHNFQELKAQITESDELQSSINELLQQELPEISAKLDTITNALSSIASRIDSLSDVGRALIAPADALSEQALQLLKYFQQSQSTKMIVFKFPESIGFMPGNKARAIREERFIEDDLTALELFNFIQLTDHNGSGDPIYSITRPGSNFASSLDEIDLDSPLWEGGEIGV